MISRILSIVVGLVAIAIVITIANWAIGPNPEKVSTHFEMTETLSQKAINESEETLEDIFNIWDVMLYRARLENMVSRKKREYAKSIIVLNNMIHPKGKFVPPPGEKIET